MDVAGEYRYQRLTWEEMNEAIAAQPDKEPVVSVQEIKADGDAGELGW